MLALSANAALAQDTGPRITAAVTAGTLGIGPELGLRLSDRLGMRANATFLNFGGDFSSDDVDYHGDVKLNSYGMMVDVYPFGGGFRVSGGARINRNRVNVLATPTGAVEIGDTTYTAAQIGTLAGRADVKKFAPALTFGWGSGNHKGFMFGFEGGVLFQGAARLGTFTASGTASADQRFRADLERERLSLQSDIDRVKLFPIAQTSIGWRF